MQHAPIDSAYSYIEKRKAEILSLLQEFVEIPSCSREPEVMPAATEWVCTLLKNEGYQVRTWDVGHGNAPVIVADLKGQEEGAPVIFSGHYDTALYRELQAQNPFRIEDGKVYGTGVLDMKGGIVIAIYAVRAAVQAGLNRPIRLLLAGDEEINHLGSHCAEILTEEGAGALCAFNMETGLEAVEKIALGGSSDAAYLTMAGVPTVCSCGTMGEWNHTVREYAMVDSLYQRAKLFAGALLRMDQFAAQTAAPEQGQ